jgi:hypothetical protein
MVEHYYGPEHQELLDVAPGLTSPGTLYDYTHGDDLVGSADPEQAYVERLLPIRLALDQVYVRRASLQYDAVLVARTLGLIAAIAVGRRVFAEPPELAEARLLLSASIRAQGSRRSAVTG